MTKSIVANWRKDLDRIESEDLTYEERSELHHKAQFWQTCGVGEALDLGDLDYRDADIKSMYLPEQVPLARKSLYNGDLYACLKALDEYLIELGAKFFAHTDSARDAPAARKYLTRIARRIGQLGGRETVRAGS